MMFHDGRLILHEVPKMFHEVLVLVFQLLGCGCVQASPIFHLVFSGLLLCSGAPRSWSCLCWALVVQRLIPFLAMALLVSGFAQASTGLSFAFACRWLCTGLPQS